MWIIVVPKVGQYLGLVNIQDGNTRSQQDVVLWSLFLGEVIVIAISYCYMHYLISIGSPHYILHFSTVAHMKDFALGGLVAIYCELLQPLRGILPSKQKYVPQLSTVQRLTLECGMLVASIHVFLIVPFSPIDLTWYYSYGSFVLSAETLMVLILLAVFQKERLQGERMFTIFPIYFFYNDLYAMLGIAAYTLYVFHLPIIVWTNTACHSSSDVYCLARGAVVIIFILIVASVISFKFEVPLMLRIAAVKKFSSVFIGMVSSMVLMLCLILLVTKGAENPRGTSSDLDNMGGLSHPLNIDGNSSHAYYTLIENRAFHNSLLNELSPFFANQGIFESTGLPGSTDATKIIDLNLYETFDSIGKGVSVNVLVVLKSKRSCTLLELLPSWIKTQREKYLNLIGGIHLLAIYDSQLPHDKKIDGLTSACEVDGIIPTLVDSITQIDVSKINNTKFMNLCLDDCRYAMGSWNTNIFDGITLTELRQALAGMVVSILEQAPQLGPFFDKNVVVEEYESNGNTVAGVDKSSDGQLGIAVVGDSTAHRFGIYIKRLYPAIMDKCKQNGQNNTFMRTMQRYKVYNLGVPGLNFPTEISKPESNLRTGLRKSISHFDVTVAMLSSAHLSWELITPNLADRAFGNLLSTLSLLYDTGVKRVYMVDCQYSYETTTVQKGYRIPKKEFMIDGPLKGVNMNRIAANEGPHFLHHYFLRCINRLWDRHESFLRRIGSTKVYVNDSCINDKAMRQTLCYGLVVRTVLSEELLPHLMELKNMLRIIDLSYMSCPSPKIAPSYIMCKQGGFGYSDMRPDGAHAGGQIWRFHISKFVGPVHRRLGWKCGQYVTSREVIAVCSSFQFGCDGFLSF